MFQDFFQVCYNVFKGETNSLNQCNNNHVDQDGEVKETQQFSFFAEHLTGHVVETTA